MLIATFLVIISAMLALPIFRALTILSRRRNKLTPFEVAMKIEAYMDGTGGVWDWDEFLSIPIANETLDDIRLRCSELTSSAPISIEKRRELTEIINALRQSPNGGK